MALARDMTIFGSHLLFHVTGNAYSYQWFTARPPCHFHDLFWAFISAMRVRNPILCAPLTGAGCFGEFATKGIATQHACPLDRSLGEVAAPQTPLHLAAGRPPGGVGRRPALFPSLYPPFSTLSLLPFTPSYRFPPRLSLFPPPSNLLLPSLLYPPASCLRPFSSPLPPPAMLRSPRTLPPLPSRP